MNITATVSRIEAFTLENPEGEHITWNITQAKQILGNRPHDLEIPLDQMRQALEFNHHSGEIDRDYAMTRDLSQPIITVISVVDETKNQIKMTIIDGWHRIVKAVAEGKASLPVHVMRPSEEVSCRCHVDPASGMLISIHNSLRA